MLTKKGRKFIWWLIISLAIFILGVVSMSGQPFLLFALGLLLAIGVAVEADKRGLN